MIGRNLVGRLWAVQQMVNLDDSSHQRLAELLAELRDPDGLGRLGTPEQAASLGLDAPLSIVFEREQDRDLVLHLVHAVWGDPLAADFDNRPQVTDPHQPATSDASEGA